MVEVGKFTVYKYIIQDGIASIPDSFFIRIFNQVMIEGGNEHFFMLSKEEELSPYKFMNWCKSNHFYFIEHEGVPLAFNIIQEIRPKFGIIDIYVFKRWWGKEIVDIYKEEVAKWMLDTEWNAMVSFIPIKNQRIIKSLEHNSWETLGIIRNSRINMKTGELEDSFVTYTNKDMYKEANDG